MAKLILNMLEDKNRIHGK